MLYTLFRVCPFVKPRFFINPLPWVNICIEQRACLPAGRHVEVRGTYLSYLRNLIFDEHVFIQLKENGTVSRFYFYKRVGPDFLGETFRILL